ncbi:MAG: 3-deoxy-D-manno-octulosonic acid kinase [Woeseiaceae bacterium]|nr:3-deoxy-D-manno-octulosonic acid kinase [Woeseiaceae bacterium]
MTESVEKTATGAILYDRSVISQIDEARFEPGNWLHSEPVAGSLGSAGRGNTMFVGNIPRQFVLRHYMRGGLVGKFVRDKYLWTSEEATRSFAEWRILAKMADSGLRVPRPAAARYCRRGPFYTADIITVRIPEVHSLSVLLAEKRFGAEFWSKLGENIQAFHAAGVYHADMNAHNLQLDSQDNLWMLDFDRGRLLPPGPWQQRTLSRLHRSLEKIRSQNPALNFSAENWEALLEGYFEASRSA